MFCMFIDYDDPLIMRQGLSTSTSLSSSDGGTWKGHRDIVAGRGQFPSRMDASVDSFFLNYLEQQFWEEVFFTISD